MMTSEEVVARIEESLQARRGSVQASGTRPIEGVLAPAEFEARYPNLAAPAAEEYEPQRSEAAEAREQAIERRRREQLIERFFDGDAAAQKVYGACRLGNFKATTASQREVLEAVKEYASTIAERRLKREGLLFYGPCGTGKDHLAIAVCRSAMERHGLSALRINGQEWYGDLRDRIDAEHAPSERSVIERLARPDLLLVSDPLPPFTGSASGGKLSDQQATMLYRLVERRYWQGKITLVTVNVWDDDEAHSRMGVPTWDRLNHGAWSVRCNWPSFRKPARRIGAK